MTLLYDRQEDYPLAERHVDAFLELNPRGDTWYMSSATGEMIQKDNGVEFMSQFGALDVAARVLADKTLELAKR